MEDQSNRDVDTPKQRNYTPWVVFLSILINAIVVLLIFMPKYEGLDHLDLTILPMMNAIFNSFTTVFLLAALFFIRQKNVKMHRRFIFAAFTSTALFLITYLTYHSLAESTHFGGEGFIKYVYYFVLITHIVLAAVIVPLALLTLARGLNMQVEKHRKIARWTMPLWLYVSITGVLVYILISPYY
jgi:putative membrane protein